MPTSGGMVIVSESEGITQPALQHALGLVLHPLSNYINKPPIAAHNTTINRAMIYSKNVPYGSYAVLPPDIINCLFYLVYITIFFS